MSPHETQSVSGLSRHASILVAGIGVARTAKPARCRLWRPSIAKATATFRLRNTRSPNGFQLSGTEKPGEAAARRSKSFLLLFFKKEGLPFLQSIRR
jgi:hypothetical protein